MSRELIVHSTSLETRIAILENDVVAEILIERHKTRGILGNIYKGRVTRVLPGMQAAFVDIGLDRHAFLYVADFVDDLDEEYGDFLDPSDRDVALEQAPPPVPARRSQSRRATKAVPEEAPSVRRAPPTRPTRASEPSSPQVAPTVEGKPSEEVPRREEPVVAIPQALTSPASLGAARSTPLLPYKIPTYGRRRRVKAKPERSEPLLPSELVPLPTSEVSSEKKKPDNQATIADDHRDLLAIRSNPRRSGEERSSRRPGGRGNLRVPKISELLKEGQEVLVQIAKEPIGKKGARITSHVALPGRYVVYMPTVDHAGVSRKISTDKERARLKRILLKLRGDFQRGFIIRTVADGRSEQELGEDMAYLTRMWESIRQKAEKATAPALIHAEPGLLERVIRDRVSDDFKYVRIDDEQEYARVAEFIHSFNPNLVDRVRLYRKSQPIFDEYRITSEIEQALKHKVWLKSGGHIVIHQTEALVAVDVNTGKYVGRSNSLEDTITHTNLDAVHEVARQIRLRDLGGIIVIDFIDMDDPRNRRRVLESLQRELAKDKSPFKILRFNEFGLVAITRKRVKQSLEKALCQPCEYCEGTGMTKSVRTVAYAVHEEIKRMVPYLSDSGEVLIRCHPQVAETLHDEEPEVICEIRDMTSKTVSIKADPLMHVEQFYIVES